MSFEYLDVESEELLKKLLDSSEMPRNTIRGTAIDFLVQLGYVNGNNVTTLSDSGPCYIVRGITQKGKSYFEMKYKYEKDQKKLSHREWRIAIISAVIGAIIGLIPFFIEIILE